MQFELVNIEFFIPDPQLLTEGPVTLVTVFKTLLNIPLCHNQQGYGRNNNYTRRPAKFQAGITC